VCGPQAKEKKKKKRKKKKGGPSVRKEGCPWALVIYKVLAKSECRHQAGHREKKGKEKEKKGEEPMGQDLTAGGKRKKRKKEQVKASLSY